MGLVRRIECSAEQADSHAGRVGWKNAPVAGGVIALFTAGSDRFRGCGI